jgi:hypothetical protein
MRSKFFKKFNNSFVISFLSLAILVTYNNCGDVSLSTPMPIPDTIVGNKVSTFDLPMRQAEKSRIVFFVDMSVSMVHGLCPCDLAADNQDNPGLCQTGGFDPSQPIDPDNLSGDCNIFGIRIGQGVDPYLFRLDVIKNWIDDIEANANNPEEIRYLIVPFNGGKVERSRNDPMSFVSATDAKLIVDELIEQQIDSEQFYRDFQNRQLGGFDDSLDTDGLTLGTTVASKRIEQMKTAISQEIDALENSFKVVFELVVFSDGVPKPRTKHFKKAVRRIWDMAGWGNENASPGSCVLDDEQFPQDCTCICGDKIDLLIDGMADEQIVQSCNAYYNHGVGLIGQRHCAYGSVYGGMFMNWIDQSGTTSSIGFRSPLIDRFGEQIPPITDSGSGGGILSRMYLSWGDPLENTPNKIAHKLKDVRMMIESTASINSRMSFVWLNPGRVSPEMRNDKENWILRAQTQGLANRFKTLTSDSPPFSLLSVGDDLESYKLGSFFIISPYVRVNASGILKADSDADGLFDDEEVGLGFDPTNPRTNGRCLDIMTRQGVCPPMSCNARLDLDGDGLNECEERNKNTNDRDFDSDGDSIPDGLEVIYRYDPEVNDQNLDSNADGQSNFSNFKLGLGPLHRTSGPSAVNPSYITVYDIELMDWVQENLDEPKRGLYRVQLHQLPSLSLTNSSGFDLFYSPVQNDETKVPVSLVGGAHSNIQMPVLVLTRIENTMHNGDVHWAYQSLNLLNGASQTIDIDLQQLDFMRSMDPQQVGN